MNSNEEQVESSLILSPFVLEIIQELIKKSNFIFPWNCLRCTAENHLTVSTCQFCHEMNPSYSEEIASEIIAKKRLEHIENELEFNLGRQDDEKRRQFQRNQIEGKKKQLIAVLHLISSDDSSISFHQRAIIQARIAINNGADGLFLIPGEGGLFPAQVLECYTAIRNEFPTTYIGINFLYPLSLPLLLSLPSSLNALWVDFGVDRTGVHSQMINLSHSLRPPQAAIKLWSGDIFGGFFFKGFNQMLPENDDRLLNYVHLAFNHYNVLTTSGPGTGKPIPIVDLTRIYSVCQARDSNSFPSLAIASGVTVENVSSMLPYARYFVVGTGIERSSQESNTQQFYAEAGLDRAVDVGYLDGDLVRDLAEKIHQFEG